MLSGVAVPDVLGNSRGSGWGRDHFLGSWKAIQEAKREDQNCGGAGRVGSSVFIGLVKWRCGGLVLGLG